MTFMKALLVLNDAPYGSERTYDGSRLAGALGRSPDHKVRVFLLGDELMLDQVVRHKGEIGACGTCMDARCIGAGELSAGVHRSTIDELVQWTAWADKVLVF